MVLNGLKGSDLIVFNYLLNSELPAPVSLAEIAELSHYEYSTITKAAKRLEEEQYIKRYRDRRGQPYTYEILNGDNHL